MPSPIKPSDVRAILPTVGGNFCDKFLRFITGFGQLFLQDLTYRVAESEYPTAEYKTDICNLNCQPGTGTPNPNLAAPTGVNATDGAFSDKVRVSWDTVTGATGYEVYRAPAGRYDPSIYATLIASITAPTVIVDDEDAVSGTTYVYWVKSKTATETSAFSDYDVGSADAPTSDLDAVADLSCTQGHSANNTSPIGLVFTPPAGATKYSVFRNTVDDYATATEILTDVTPQDTKSVVISAQFPDSVWDNFDTILVWHFPPSPTVHYFFWVVAKKDSPPGFSPESNSAEGWVKSFYAPFLGNAFRLERGESATEGVDFSGASIRVVLVGSAGGGAGGSQIYGGGGGGAGPVIVEEFAIAPGDVVELVSDPDVDDTGNAAALANGADFNTLLFKINSVTKLTANGGAGGVFSGSGGGAGGAGASGTGTATPTIYAGHDGLPGVGAAGGASGYYFGNRRYPSAHFNNFTVGGYDGNGPAAGDPGGGSKAAPGTEVLAVGGYGRCGYVVIVSES